MTLASASGLVPCVKCNEMIGLSVVIGPSTAYASCGCRYLPQNLSELTSGEQQ